MARCLTPEVHQFLTPSGAIVAFGRTTATAATATTGRDYLGVVLPPRKGIPWETNMIASPTSPGARGTAGRRVVASRRTA